MGIPTDITVRLAIDSVTLAVPDTFFKAVTGTFFTLLSRSIYRSTVPGKGEFFKGEQVSVGRNLKKIRIKNSIEKDQALQTSCA